MTNFLIFITLIYFNMTGIIPGKLLKDASIQAQKIDLDGHIATQNGEVANLQTVNQRIVAEKLQIEAGSAPFLEIVGNSLRIKKLAVSEIVVDVASSDLTAALAANYSAGTELQAGDFLIIQNATGGTLTYQHIGTANGDASDFILVEKPDLDDAYIRGLFNNGQGLNYDPATGEFSIKDDGPFINQLGDRIEISRLSSQTWYFGQNAGLQFNSDGSIDVLDNSPMVQDEGGFVMSDANGKFLFYTNGQEVYDRNNNLLESGLLGHPSSSTSAVAAPIYGTSLYYIITADVKFQGTHGTNYNVLDMSLNGGLGQIIEKNTNLRPQNDATEKIGLVEHANGKDWWVILHGSNNNRFYVYLLDANGLNLVQDIAIGATYTDFEAHDSVGFIKSNFAKNKIAVSSFGLFGGNAQIEIFDFDNATGVISNHVQTGTYVNPYGIQFSTNDKYLYITETSFDALTFDRIYRYDLEAGVRELYWEQTTGSTTRFHFGMQMALNGKIYVSFNDVDALGVIDDPNSIQNTFVKDGQSIAPGLAKVGLPYYPVSATGFGLELSNIPATVNEVLEGTSKTKAVTAYTLNQIRFKPSLQKGIQKVSPNNTTGDGAATGIVFPSKPKGGLFFAIVGASFFEIGDGVKTDTFYVSRDGGATALAWTDIEIGDELYFNGTIAGFDLANATDRISVKYSA